MQELEGQIMDRKIEWGILLPKMFISGIGETYVRYWKISICLDPINGREEYDTLITIRGYEEKPKDESAVHVMGATRKLSRQFPWFIKPEETNQHVLKEFEGHISKMLKECGCNKRNLEEEASLFENADLGESVEIELDGMEMPDNP
jgi:hypothetical protein